MGLLEMVADLVLNLLMSSDSKVGKATNKAVDRLSKEDAIRKDRLLSDAQIKAHASGNKDLEERIKKERQQYR